jgi:hypothetical protein
MLEIILILVLNFLFAIWLKKENLYPRHKVYGVLSLIPPLAILYGMILTFIMVVMFIIESVKEILE